LTAKQGLAFQKAFGTRALKIPAVAFLFSLGDILKYPPSSDFDMILTKPAILREIKHKRVKVTPFDKRVIGPASIDLSLGDKLRVFTNPTIIKIVETSDGLHHTKLISINKGYALQPGELVLGITKETLKLPDDICGFIHSRSRFARLGLMTHITAPFLQPGINNKQTLEIYNASKNVLVLKPGVKICAVVLCRTDGSAHYQGKYKRQAQP